MSRWPGLLPFLSFACGQAVDPAPGSPPELRLAGPICAAAACQALAGPCQVGACDERTGTCRVSAAREGEPCLEGNACGPALCHHGECSALGPPACPGADECLAGVCRPERGGCVDEPRDVSGASCETALPLPSAGTRVVSAGTTCGAATEELGCGSALLGPSAHFALDLRSASAPTHVELVIDAEFGFEALLRRGTCGDNVFQACARAFQADLRSRVLSATLAPDYYELIVAGREQSDRGAVSVTTAIAAARCAGPAANAECDAAYAVDASLPVQTLIGNATCGAVSADLGCDFASVGDVFYELDLSSRATPALLELDLANVDPSAPSALLGAALIAGASCDQASACGARLARRVLPGRYRIRVTQVPGTSGTGASSDAGYRRATDAAPPPSSPFALRLRLSDDCTAPANDTWQEAIELDAGAARQWLAGNTACARDDFSGACNTDRGAPELFYRLDLRGQTEPRGYYLSGHADSNLAAYLLIPDDSGVPSRVAGCKTVSGPTEPSTTDSSALFHLAPRLYYLVLDGRLQNAGRFELELREYAGYPARVNCFDASSPTCLEDSEPACADSRARPECLQAALECGLEVAVHDAFCAAFPGCCEGTAALADCDAAWRANLQCK